MPKVDAVNIELHVTEAVEPDNVHDVNAPVTPVSDSETVPVGGMTMPGLESVTVTKQVEACPTGTGLVQETVVAVPRLLTSSDIVAVPVPLVLVALTRTVKVPLEVYVCVSVVAVPLRLSTVVPSPHWTVMLVGEPVVEKFTVTAWLMTDGFGASEVIVTVGIKMTG